VIKPYAIPFNYSKINNYAVQFASGSHLLFLNNDTQVITPDWLEAMLEQSQRASIGAVGAKLLYSDQTIQHAGIVMTREGCKHGHRYYGANEPGYQHHLQVINNYLAVTAACLMCKKNLFEHIGGFDEELTIALNDVDLCLKMHQAGYHNIYLPHVCLYHFESKSRGFDDNIEEQTRFQYECCRLRARWAQYFEHDPCYNPGLTQTSEYYCLAK
jgi:GT2 family glycosyltransferase